MTEEDSSKYEFEMAVSVLLEYGFSKALITRTLKKILKVYAGNEAWPLIKENGYEVVIERLISDAGPQERKSQGRARHGLDKEKKQHNLDSETGKAGGVSGSIISSSSSLLVTPTLDMETIDIQSHQGISWTKNGSFPLPAWLEVLDMSKKVQQKFSDLHVILERIDKDCSKQGDCVGKCVLDAMAVKDEKTECLEGVRHDSSSKAEILKNEEAIQTGDHADEKLNSDFGTSFHQHESNSLKTQKFANAVHTDHAETCSQQSNPAMPQTQKSADVLRSQQDLGPIALEATGKKWFERKNSHGNDAKRRKGVFKYQETFETVAASPTIPPRTQSTGERTNNLLYATERLDIARMSACKLTRRRDGGPNPMFSRMQKRKQAGAGANLQSNEQEGSDLNGIESGIPATDVDADEFPPCALVGAEENQDSILSPDSPRLPPGFWEHSRDADPVSSPDSPKLPPGFWEPCGASQGPNVSGQIENQDPVSSDETPLLPPGFSEPHDDSSQEFPRLPPGFCEPSGKAEERFQPPLSPELPPGFWEPSGNCKVFRSARARMAESRKILETVLQEENMVSKDHVECKGTPSRQVFIANIPEEFEGVEQKLYSLVREVLAGFKSVPISTTLPRKIQVRGDHAFVEFCWEAMAGIFIDAYQANASILKIDGEQLLAARNMHLMKRDIQLRLAVSTRLKGQVLDPRNVFYLGNVPSDWQNEERLYSHLASLLQGDASSTLISKTLTIYTIPDFSDVYVYFQSSNLAETFFLRCLSDKEHLEEISDSLFVCRNPAFLPRASRACHVSQYQR